MAVILVTCLQQKGQSSCCFILSECLLWILLEEHQMAESWMVLYEGKEKSTDKFTYFVFRFPPPPALSFILIFHFCHPFLSRSFAFLCTEACSFLSREQFKEIYFWTRESCSMSNAADDWGWTSSLSFCTTFLFPPLHTNYPISPHW